MLYFICLTNGHSGKSSELIWRLRIEYLFNDASHLDEIVDEKFAADG